MAARLVTICKRSDSISSILKALHWLPVSKRIDYTILLITYKSLYHSSSRYLHQNFKIHVPVRNLRSASQFQLFVPKTNTSWGDRAYANVAQKLWNGIPGAVVAQWIRPRTLNHEVPGSNLGSGSSALWQGTLSSLPSPSERT